MNEPEPPPNPDPFAEAIADRTPVPFAGVLGASGALESTVGGLQLLAAVAESFRAANTGIPSDREELFRWGTLEVRRLLGEGSFGEVYAAWDRTLQREVALKLRRNPSDGVGSGALMWLDEARSLARVHHRNVLTIYGANLHGGRAGIWTELVRGRTLETLLASEGPRPARDAIRISRDLCSAIAAVHRAGLAHGDVKTANVMLEEPVAGDERGPAEARVVLMDFGTAQTHAPDETPIGALSVGTPLAMAPEVLEGGSASLSSDIYSAGVVLFRLLTGRYPVEADSVADLRRAHRQARRARVRKARPDCPAALARVTDRALAVNPRARFATAQAMADALDRCADPWRRWLTRGLLAAIASSVVLAGIVAGLALRDRAREQPMQLEALPAAKTPGLLEPVWSIQGSGEDPLMGEGVHFVGDVNGDGFDDVLVPEAGWSGSQHGQGRVLLFAGGPQGLGTTPLWTFEGSQAEAHFGSQTAAAGDLDGDGFADFVVQERQGFDPGSPRAIGAVYVFRGGPHGPASRPDRVLRSDQPLVGFGDGLACAGDVNCDGYDDLLVGSAQYTRDHEAEGAAFLYLGGPSGIASAPCWIQYGGQAGANLGWKFGHRGDVNGDGYSDVLIAYPHWSAEHSNAGKVSLFLGGPHGLASTPVWSRTGDRNDSEFGRNFTFVGDLNGDGFDDFAIGSPFRGSHGVASRGAVWLFAGGPRGPSEWSRSRIEGVSTGARLGEMIAAAGDVDGDGHADFLVSAPLASLRADARGSGVVLLESGGGIRSDPGPAWVFAPDTVDYGAGWGLDGGGDVDGDGHPEVLIGIPGTSNQGGKHGRVTLWARPRARTTRASR